MNDNSSDNSTDVKDLEKIVNDEMIVSYLPECVRQKSNWSNTNKSYKFDKVAFDPQKLLNDIPNQSPKLDVLLKNIEKLDKDDEAKYGKKFKHFIFSDLKSSNYGAKLIASALIAKGMTLGYTAELLSAPSSSKSSIEDEDDEDDDSSSSTTSSSKSRKIAEKYGKIKLLSDTELTETPFNNFFLLASIGVYEQPITTTLKKEILRKFNERPKNIYGKTARIIIMDSGFKEGIDLFDIKYIHIFEPSVNAADQKQVIGRGTRTCGQKGLDFHPTQGWRLNVFIYDLEIPETMKSYFLEANTAFDLYLKSIGMDFRTIHLTNALEKISILGSVDYELNQNIHNFSIEDDIEKDESGEELVYGGTPKGRRKIRVDPNSTVYGDAASPTPKRKIRVDPNSIVYGDLTSNIQKKDDEINEEIHNLETANSVPEIPDDYPFPPPPTVLEFEPLREHIQKYFGQFAWGKLKMENQCGTVEPESDDISVKTPSPVKSPSPVNTPSPVKSPSPVNTPSPVKSPSPVNSSPVNTPSPIKSPSPVNSSSVKSPSPVKTPSPVNSSPVNTPSPVKSPPSPEKTSTNVATPIVKGGAPQVIQYSPSQDFIRNYFTPQNPAKGMLLWHSVGTGKTCAAIACASSSFEKQGYTILWVTRYTLKPDIWKNMFDSVCNESIRELILKDGPTAIPTDSAKRMALLSKAWSIRPISYKQFSNLITKQNQYYDQLVKRNGDDDPLRKTLIIIDEAHKLYGGGDLSSIERPDMFEFHRAVMKSYEISGADSCRLLLMTATPITESPMELIKIINLCKPIDQQIPTIFEDFKEAYLTDEGEFTDKGRDQYLNDIAGYLSYLNREKDARQFSQPVVEHINVPLITDDTLVKKYDSDVIRDFMNSDITKLKKEIETTTEKLEKKLTDVDPSHFEYLKEQCTVIRDSDTRKRCNKIVNQNITELKKEAKSLTNDLQDRLKGLRETVKNNRLFKNDQFAKIKENIAENEQEYEKYKNSLYYNLRKKCGKKTRRNVAFIKEADEHNPQVIEWNDKIQQSQDTIRVLEEMKTLRIQQLTERTSDITEMEKLNRSRISQLRMNIIQLNQQPPTPNITAKINSLETDMNTLIAETEHIIHDYEELKQETAEKNAESTQQIKQLMNDIKQYTKDRKKAYADFKKSIKMKMAEKKKKETIVHRAEKKLNKTKKVQQELRTEIEDEGVKELVKKYEEKIQKELKEEISKKTQKLEKREEEKASKKQMKEELKEIKHKQLLVKNETKRIEIQRKKIEQETKRKIAEIKRRENATKKAIEKKEKEILKRNKTTKKKTDK
jgi:hypothetical protein